MHIIGMRRCAGLNREFTLGRKVSADALPWHGLSHGKLLGFATEGDLPRWVPVWRGLVRIGRSSAVLVEAEDSLSVVCDRDTNSSILLSMQRQSGIFEVRGDAVFGEWSLQPSEFGRDMLKLAPVISQARVIHEFFEGSMSEWFEHYLMGRVTLSAYRDQETP